METISSNIDQLKFDEMQAAAAEFTGRLDSVIARQAETGEDAKWKLSMPANDGHAGLGLKAFPGYEMHPCELEINALEDGYALTLWTDDEQKLGRPHSLQSSPEELEIKDSLYDGLQVVLRPDADEPIIFKWVIKDWRQEQYPGISAKHVQFFTDICILQAEIKTGLKPKPVRRLEDAVGTIAAGSGA